MSPPDSDSRPAIDPTLAALLDAACVPAFVTAAPGADATILFVNAAFRARTGYDAAALDGHGLRRIARERATALLREGAASEAQLFARDGTAFWASLTQAPVAGSGLWLGQLIDISRARDAESALALARQREALGLLTNSVAHEFNNFLQILIGYIDGLRRRLDTSPDPFVQRALSRSTDASERATTLTRQLLAFSRRIAPEVRPVDLDAVVAEIAARLKPGLPARVNLVLRTTPGLPPALSHPVQLELALSHLISNAVEAMPEGGTVTLASFRVPPGDRTIQRPADGAVGLLVTDTGTGMSAEMLARALGPFATSREAGRGAGLAIVNGLMKRQNGTITLDSKPGEGTGVRLVFPAAERRPD